MQPQHVVERIVTAVTVTTIEIGTRKLNAANQGLDTATDRTTGCQQLLTGRTGQRRSALFS